MPANVSTQRRRRCRRRRPLVNGIVTVRQRRGWRGTRPRNLPTFYWGTVSVTVSSCRIDSRTRTPCYRSRPREGRGRVSTSSRIVSRSVSKRMIGRLQSPTPRPIRRYRPNTASKPPPFSPPRPRQRRRRQPTTLSPSHQPPKRYQPRRNKKTRVAPRPSRRRRNRHRSKRSSPTYLKTRTRNRTISSRRRSERTGRIRT
mmetsp:Transcript_14691/g.18524  ORF Transcript_14691/g.18524 Transcript_14691/m.18524 type:complete len:200 (-) Transcript_14691:606-1205(-)